MRDNNRLEREIEHLNPDGSRKTPIPGWPSQEEVDKASTKFNEFNERLAKTNYITTLNHLIPYIREYLETLGSLSGVIKYGSPMHFHEGEYISENLYNFLGKEVKGSVRLDKEDLSNSKLRIFEDFASYFPDHVVRDLGEGKIVLR